MSQFTSINYIHIYIYNNNIIANVWQHGQYGSIEKNAASGTEGIVSIKKCLPAPFFRKIKDLKDGKLSPKKDSLLNKKSMNLVEKHEKTSTLCGIFGPLPRGESGTVRYIYCRGRSHAKTVGLMTSPSTKHVRT